MKADKLRNNWFGYSKGNFYKAVQMGLGRAPPSFLVLYFLGLSDACPDQTAGVQRTFGAPLGLRISHKQ